MKKLTLLWIIILIITLLAACGSTKNDTNADSETSVSKEATTEETGDATAAESGEETGTAVSAESAEEETGAAASAEIEDFAGEYTFYGTYLNEKFVTIDDLMGTTTILDADGTGYLNWGENNEGPISEWTVKDNQITIKAGVSTISGNIGNGVLMLSIGDEEASFLECYVRDDADTSIMPQITAEEWAEMIMDSIE